MLILCGMGGYSSFAATVLNPGATSGLKYWWDFTTNTAPIDYTSGSPVVGAPWGEDFGNNAAGVGQISSGHTPWKASPGIDAGSFTVSFDIRNLQAADWKNVFAMNTNGSSQDNNFLCLQTTDSGLSLYATGFGGGASGTNYINLSNLRGDSSWNTVTITSDGLTVSLYVNGILAGNMAYQTSGSVTGMQFGKSFGGGRDITGADMDNVGIWDRALSADEVKLLTVPEPGAAALGLMAFTPLLMRRRRR